MMLLDKLSGSEYKAIIFDLDDTVYDEIEYLKRAYKYISEKIVDSESTNHYTENTIYKYLLRTFINEGRVSLFQKAKQKFNINDFTIEQFLNCLRTVNICENEIQVRKSIFEFINKYQNKKDLFILTNGNITQQKNKIRSLNIPFKERIKVYFSSSLGKELEKPNAYFIQKILHDNNLEKEQVIFIGDTEIDKEAAQAAGIDFLFYQELLSLNI